MTPHDPARRFFPEFNTMTVCVAGKKITGAVTVEVDDRGGAVLHIGHPPVAEIPPVAEMPKPAVAPIPQPPVEIPAKKPGKKLGLVR